jgi:hypothetical protein
MIGLLCGLAIYNFTIIDLPFTLALFKKLLKKSVYIHSCVDRQKDRQTDKQTDMLT